MPAAEYDTKTFPLVNRGLVTKLDPAQLLDGQFSRMKNLTSLQEGTLTVAPGTKLLTTGGGIGLVIHTLSRLRNGASVKRYYGEGSNLYRSDGFAAGPSLVASDISIAVSDYAENRWSAVEYSAASAGRPMLFLAAAKKMLRDDGSYASPLRPWGNLPPLLPAVAEPAGVDVVALHTCEGTAGVTVGGGGVLTGSNRYTATIEHVQGTGYVRMQVNTLVGAAVGQLVHIGGTITTVIDKITDINSVAYVYAYCGTATPSVGQTIVDASIDLAIAGTGIHSLTANAATANAAFDGTAEDGYVTDDPVHMSLFVSDPTKIKDIRLQLDVSESGTWVDYFEKSILPSGATNLVSGSQTADVAVSERIIYVDRGVYGGGKMEIRVPITATNVDQTTVGMQPAEMNPMVAGQWSEIDILKSEFLKIGKAGSGNAGWHNLRRVRVLIQATGAVTVRISSIFAYGGKNLESSSINPYEWVYTYADPDSHEESNPCVPMVRTLKISPNRRAAKITCAGSSEPQYSTAAGQSTIRIYRRGGTLPDEFRLVGSATNPGDGNSVSFIDNASDESLYEAKLLEMDNDPPVTADLPVPLMARIDSIVGTAPGLCTLNLTGIPANFGNLTDVLRVGSLVEIGTGETREWARVKSIAGAAALVVYLQFTHKTYANDPSEVVRCSAVTGSPCDLACQVGDQIMLAGNVLNTDTVYLSKRGRPRSFPVVNPITGTAYTQKVGSPSNPIRGLAEYSDGIVAVLCHDTIKAVRVFSGRMEQAQDTRAGHGLIAKGVYCRVGNEIWYLSYDGIYSWGGGESVKRTEAIDGIFQGLSQGGLEPMDYTKAARCQLVYYGNEVHFLYFDAANNSHLLTYHRLYDRWEPRDIGGTGHVTALWADETGLYTARATAAGNVYQMRQGTTDGWTVAPDGGTAIPFEFQTAFFNLGGSALDKQWGDVIIEVTNPHNANQNFTLAMLYDYSGNVDATDTFNVVATPGRNRYILPLGNGQAKEARAAAIRVSGTTSRGFTFHELGFSVLPLNIAQRGRPSDWNDLGYAYDKHLRELTVEYDSDGQNVDVVLEAKTGINGNTDATVGTFTLNGQRSKVTFPIPAGHVVKLVRLRPVVATPQFKLWGYTIEKENYPPDRLYHTEYSDCGTPFEKYFQQVLLDIDTGGIAASVTLEVDGVQTSLGSVTTTFTDRRRALTTPANLRGRKARLLFTHGNGGKTQVFSQDIVALPVDRGAVKHSFAWDDLGYPFDKRLRTITIEHEISTPTAQMRIDVLRGLAGEQTISTAMTVTITGGGRRLETFNFPDGTMAKMIRVYPVSTNVNFLSWRYEVDRTNYPADVVLSTEPTDLGWPCEKILRNIIIDADTGGSAVPVDIVGDGVVLHTISFRGTIDARSGVFAMPTVPTVPTEPIARRFNIVSRPAAGQEFQLFDVKYDAMREPCAVTHWDSYEQNFGSNGLKLLRQVWVEYVCPGGIRLRVYVDGGKLLYDGNLPVHTHRKIWHGQMPIRNAGTSALNKSHLYRFVLDSLSAVSPFKIYRDGGRAESINFTGDQRTSWSQSMIWSNMELPV